MGDCLDLGSLLSLFSLSHEVSMDFERYEEEDSPLDCDDLHYICWSRCYLFLLLELLLVSLSSILLLDLFSKDLLYICSFPWLYGLFPFWLLNEVKMTAFDTVLDFWFSTTYHELPWVLSSSIICQVQLYNFFYPSEVLSAPFHKLSDFSFFTNQFLAE